jgi:hypothetical protein
MGELAHVVVGGAHRAALACASGGEFLAHDVGVLDPDVHPGGCPGRVVVLFQGEVRFDAVTPADGEPGTGQRGQTSQVYCSNPRR